MKNISFLESPIIAHRGVHYKYRENSIEAFRRAIIEGYTIELDVHLTRDNIIVVYHDKNLKRLTGVDKDINKSTYDEIINIINIPTLEEVLKLVNGKVAIIIELKFDTIVGRLEKAVSNILDNYNGKFAVQSFNPLSILWFKIYRSSYIRGCLINRIYYKNIIINYFFYKILKPNFFALSLKILDKKYIQNLRHKFVVIGYTINNNQEYNKYYNFADNFICNIGKEPYKRLSDR